MRGAPNGDQPSLNPLIPPNAYVFRSRIAVLYNPFLKFYKEKIIPGLAIWT
jgi:hypothetical protein